LVVIDGKSVFYRGHYAMQHLSLPDGTPTGGVFGFAMMALEAIKQFEPDYVVVAWDKSKTNIRSRRAMYPEYKANRSPMPDDMRAQIPILRDLLDAFGWPLYECDDYEADDILGTLAEKAYDEAEVNTVIITSDLDALQLVNDHTHVAALKKGLSNLEYFDSDHFAEQYNLTTEQFIDLKALMGDSSDNIPGVKGVGKVTANKLLAKYGSLDGVYDNLDEITGATHSKLEKDKDMAYLSKKLVTIMFDAPVEFEPEASDINNLNLAKLRAKLSELKFRSLQRTVDELYEQGDIDGELDVNPLDSAKKVDIGKIEGDEVLVFEVGGQLYCSDDSRWFAECDKQWLKVRQPQLLGYDLKHFLRDMWGEQTPLDAVGHDLKLAQFIINPLERSQELADIVLSRTGHELPVEPGQITPLLWQVKTQQTKELTDTGKLKTVAEDIDFPTSALLARVESRGLMLDTEQFTELAEEFRNQLIDLEQEIYGLAGEEFNIASPQQLSEILFETLALPTQGIKKNKTGYSTAASELAKLRDKHDIIDLISDYREYSKLKSTYVDPLPDHIADDGKVHTTFSLTTAQTGRLSSHDPNLQNIPVRSELGRRVRRAFVPGEGNVFVNLDYSQFELRLAAALAGEQDMIDAFNNGADIHQATAALMYDTAIDEITKHQRYSAKAVNFGILYGQGSYGLSQGTDMTQKEAKEFINRYFEVRPNIKDYIEKLKSQAQEQGYVETMMGRRRPTPDVQASNWQVRQAALRAAVNMPMQGSAADITKLAMLKLEQELPDEAKQILQVHDSIMLEVPEVMAEDIAKQGQELMQNIYKLSVKLDVDYSIEDCWK